MVYVFPMYGLGGRIWSWPIEDYVAAHLRSIPGVKVYPTRSYTQWRSIADEIKELPKGSKTVVIGHSMGAASATYVTDIVPVDLVVCYDAAGQSCSYIGKNTGKLFDFWDRAFALVPKFRPKALPGHRDKIIQTTTLFGHTQQPTAPNLLHKVANEIKAMKGQ
jgi:pimeloyl-ACP methyl ester carboxylesterase